LNKLKKILIADDDEQLLMSLSFCLGSNNYDVEAVSDGVQALHQIQKANKEQNPFELLITDLMMPNLQGHELVNELQNLNINIPTIIMTGYSEEEFITEIQQKGTRILKKPFQAEELLNAINSSLDG
jgi:CheY-like chemotaxis protein